MCRSVSPSRVGAVRWSVTRRTAWSPRSQGRARGAVVRTPGHCRWSPGAWPARGVRPGPGRAAGRRTRPPDARCHTAGPGCKSDDPRSSVALPARAGAPAGARAAPGPGHPRAATRQESTCGAGRGPPRLGQARGPPRRSAVPGGDARWQPHDCHRAPGFANPATIGGDGPATP